MIAVRKVSQYGTHSITLHTKQSSYKAEMRGHKKRSFEFQNYPRHTNLFEVKMIPEGKCKLFYGHTDMSVHASTRENQILRR